jgi:hypothetical protein
MLALSHGPAFWNPRRPRDVDILEAALAVVPTGNARVRKAKDLFLQQRDEPGLLLDQAVNPAGFAVEEAGDGGLIFGWNIRNWKLQQFSLTEVLADASS